MTTNELTVGGNRAVDITLLDAGEVVNGERTELRFKLHNKTSHTVRLNALSVQDKNTGNKFVKVLSKPVEIAPLSSDDLLVEIDLPEDAIIIDKETQQEIGLRLQILGMTERVIY